MRVGAPAGVRGGGGVYAVARGRAQTRHHHAARRCSASLSPSASSSACFASAAAQEHEQDARSLFCLSCPKATGRHVVAEACALTSLRRHQDAGLGNLCGGAAAAGAWRARAAALLCLLGPPPQSLRAADHRPRLVRLPPNGRSAASRSGAGALCEASMQRPRCAVPPLLCERPSQGWL